jgi:hypothetical protein
MARDGLDEPRVAPHGRIEGVQLLRDMQRQGEKALSPGKGAKGLPAPEGLPSQGGRIRHFPAAPGRRLVSFPRSEDTDTRRGKRWTAPFRMPASSSGSGTRGS